MKYAVCLATMLLACPTLAASGDRAACEGRDPQSGLPERETSCSAVLAEPGLPPTAQSMALIHRAWARSQLGRRALAMEDYDRAVSLDPQSFVALNERGLLKLRDGKLDAALADYNRALAINPRASYPRFGRGLVYLRKKDARKAKADLDLARKIEPDVDAVFEKIGLKP